MRHARLKPEGRDTWHPCYSHAAGTTEDRPFGPAEKEQFVRILIVHSIAELAAGPYA